MPVKKSQTSDGLTRTTTFEVEGEVTDDDLALLPKPNLENRLAEIESIARSVLVEAGHDCTTRDRIRAVYNATGRDGSVRDAAWILISIDGLRRNLERYSPREAAFHALELGLDFMQVKKKHTWGREVLSDRKRQAGLGTARQVSAKNRTMSIAERDAKWFAEDDRLRAKFPSYKPYRRAKLIAEKFKAPLGTVRDALRRRKSD